jgi:hypothetical protein
MQRSLILAAPFVLAVPVVLGLVIVFAGHPLDAGALAVGAVGWAFALALRAPVALIGQRLLHGNPERTQRAVVLSSGPLEELVRLAVVLLVGRDLSTALWIGLGWAAIEVLFSIVNGFALAQLEKRTDEEAERARAMLPPQALSAGAPWWGVIERIWASLLHIAFTLIVAAAPLTAPINAVVHSAVNVAALAGARRYPLAAVSVGGLLLALALLAVGLLLHGALAG